MKKIIYLVVILFSLNSCGSDYVLSSFYLRKDFQWLSSIEEQKTLNYNAQISAASFDFNNYTSPSIIATPDNYLMIIYETRETYDPNPISIDGTKLVDVTVKMSYDAQNFEPSAIIGGKSGSGMNSHGAPISFLTKNGNIVVLSTTGIGFGQGTATDIGRIAVSISSNNGNSWTDWDVIETNVFKPLLEKQYDRFHTISGNGITLANGTLVCMIEYKKRTDSKAVGSVILYSKNDGKDWQLGSTLEYSGEATGKRWAKIISERSDGSLLIAAVHDTGNDYKQTGKLFWATASYLDGKITSFSVTSPTVKDKNGNLITLFDYNNSGNVSGAKIKFTSDKNISKYGILLFHSYPERLYNNGFKEYSVYNCSTISISEDDGKTWNMITNIIGTDPQDKTSFRHSMMILKDGTIGLAYEEGIGQEIDSSKDQNFCIVYGRCGLYSISDGKYRYEGF